GNSTGDLMATQYYTYQQLEDIWVAAGGRADMAALMAAIALAESSGDPYNINNTDNGGTQTSWGLWQISNGTHTQPGGNWSDPVGNAKLAIQKLNTQGLQAWGTYTSGAYQRYFNPNIKPSGNPVTQVIDQAGMSYGNSSTTPFLPAAQPVLSLDALRQQDPLVAAIVTSVPELQNIFNQAVTGQWSTDKFISAVQNSHWWATHSDSARQAFAIMKSDPATWNKQISNLEATLQNFAAQIGALPSNQQLYSLAVDAITNGYDTNQAMLRQKFEQFVKPVSGLHYGGEAGTTENSIRQAEMNMGVFLPESTLDQNVQKITAGMSDVNSVVAALRTQAAATYPAYAQQINNGMTVSDIADPYVQQAQSLLEQGPGAINIMNPLIKQALQYNQNGKPAPLPLNDFENMVRQQPQWLQTKNAQDEMMGVAHRVLQDFGFNF
ncbi:MAG TPA: transglycosylase SLT domain-containing protein, partial [Ktedonobacteraceae bacterium]|nr:transglycosylase SLT domain-containing protein [Ktedonobacteraceae bacterium]